MLYMLIDYNLFKIELYLFSSGSALVQGVMEERDNAPVRSQSVMDTHAQAPQQGIDASFSFTSSFEIQILIKNY